MTGVRPAWTTLTAVGVLLPLAACLLLSSLREVMANTNAALVLVLVVVAAASLGSRVTGYASAAVSAAGFDVFLTKPYGTFAIHSAADVQTTVLLVVIGVAVTELALWGRRQQSRASEESGYLDGILETTGAFTAAVPPAAMIEHVATELVSLLDLDQACYVRRTDGTAPRIALDGTVTHRGRPLDVDRTGLPTDTEVWLPVGSVSDGDLGGFRLVAVTHVARPTLRQRQVAAVLADHVATVLRQEASQ